MAGLNVLKKQAQSSTAWRGHRMQWGHPFFHRWSNANLQDGLLDVTLLGDYGPIQRFVALPMVLLKQMQVLRGVQMFKTDLLQISVDRPTYIHVDGNLEHMHEPATVEILPKALKVLFPPKN